MRMPDKNRQLLSLFFMLAFFFAVVLLLNQYVKTVDKPYGFVTTFFGDGKNPPEP
ncbi:hypothetical protein [Chrysiogenes arsenatis]|uniref:hypothetical protein n=1 Tax=Chrysiogenes arsenatis TaxID=309797 RepID=UPI0004258AA7|nr:hypothetical protein [Chrysiogenes arsenatis]